MKLSATNFVGFVFLLMFGLNATAAILHLEEFNSDVGVASRDGIMTVGYDGGNDWVTGSFPLQGFSIPQTDALVVNSAEFTGSYAGLTKISFQMYAVNVLPSDLFIRIIDGANVFSYQFNPIAGMLNNWQTFTVDLAWSYGWGGPSEAAFNTALTSVDQVEIQLSRNTTAFQEFRLDNMQTLDTPLDGGGGGGPSAVPEPNTISLLLFVIIVGVALRRHMLSIKQSAGT